MRNALKDLYNRIFVAAIVMFSGRIIVITKNYDKGRHQDGCTMYGTITDILEQIALLRNMADSLESDLPIKKL